MEYKYIQKKEEQLEIERVIANFKQKSSDLSAKSNLLKKLEDALKENKKRLYYFEEDYFKIENQVNQIEKEIKKKKNKIKELNDTKKNAFNQINKITREMEGKNPKKEDLALIHQKSSISRYEQIKNLRNIAKECQLEVKKLTNLLNEKQAYLKNITPNYQKIKKDYEDLKLIIKNNSNRIKNLKDEIENQIELSNEKSIENLEISNLNFTRTSDEIAIEIKNLQYQKQYILKNPGLIGENSKFFEYINKSFEDLTENIKNLKNEIVKTNKEEEIIQSIEVFREIERIIEDLQIILNKFLRIINLKTSLNVVLNKESTEFQIDISIFRSKKKEPLSFDELTTPEKIFFVMVLFLSIHIYLDKNQIIFCNYLLPAKFNKRGSIYRTIKKILPQFREDKKLTNFNLIFIISNLEMKKPIENIKIINIEESKGSGKNDEK
ncbi:MAG: hypothetical protein ACTSR8_13810 [Promethearchaeota archaeon]